MPYCPKCGTHQEQSGKCLVCTFPVPSVDSETITERYPSYPTPKPINYKEFRKIFWRLGSLTLLASVLITLSLDFIDNQSFTWSKSYFGYLLVAWLILSISILNYRNPYRLTFLTTGTICGFLIVLDLGDQKMQWYLSLGMPLTLMSSGVIGFWIFLYKTIKLRYAHFSAYMIGSIAPFCVGVEWLVSAWRGDINLSWSLLVMAILIPLCILLFYVHFSLARKIDFKRFFHV